MTTLGGYVADFMQDRVALGVYVPKSVRVVRPRLTSLADHFGNRPLNQFTERAISAWLADEKRLNANSRASYLSSVRQFTAWLHKTIGHPDPCAELPKVKRSKAIPRAQSQEAVARILEACTTDRERAIVWLMVGLGLRRMEVAGLRWEHYDDRVELLLVVDAKNGNERLLPVTAEVSMAIRRVRGGGMTGPIIRSEADPHLPLSVERVGFLAGRVMQRAGVKSRPYDGVSGHALRHTAASDVLDECGDLRVVQRMLGHENLATTAIYLRAATPKQMREAMEGRTYAPRAAEDELAAHRRSPRQRAA